MRWTERKDCCFFCRDFGCFFGTCGKTLVQHGPFAWDSWEFFMGFSERREIVGILPSKRLCTILWVDHVGLVGLLIGRYPGDTILGVVFFLRQKKRWCQSQPIDIFMAFFFDFLPGFVQTTIFVRYVLQVLWLWLLWHKRLWESVVYCHPCFGWTAAPRLKKLWQSPAVPQKIWLAIPPQQILRYFVAKAWCEDRLTIQDAKALSTLWKQLSRGVATWRGWICPEGEDPIRPINIGPAHGAQPRMEPPQALPRKSRRVSTLRWLRQMLLRWQTRSWNKSRPGAIDPKKSLMIEVEKFHVLLSVLVN